MGEKFHVDTADKESVEKAFKRFDYNNNGFLSLAEIDNAVIEVLPVYAKDKPAIMRAYKAADVSKDGFVAKKEFASMINFLAYYDALYKKFKVLDVNGDKRISLKEFEKAHEMIGVASKDYKKEFEAIDLNKGGFILFEEFTIYMAKKNLDK